MDWLCPELRVKVDDCQPVTGSDINDKGEITEARLTESLQNILGNTRIQAYCNIYQLRDLVQRFAAHWGFYVKIRQSNIVCHFGLDDNRRDEYAKYAKRADAEEVTPSRKRSRSAPSSALECTFKITTSFIDHTGEARKLERWGRPVKINSAVLQHTCGCSALQHTYARKVSGFYAKTSMDRILRLFLSWPRAVALRQVFSGG